MNSYFVNFKFLLSLNSVAKSLGYKIFRYNQMQAKPASEFNYEMRFSIQSRKEQDMWNLCWTDSIIGVDFCREMRRFQRINVSQINNILVQVDLMSYENYFHSTFLECLRFVVKIY
jgi:hypothetical protein